MRNHSYTLVGFLSLMVMTGMLNAQSGITWHPLHEPGSGGRINSLAISPYNPDHYLVGGDMLGIGVSFDQGEHWEGGFGLKSYEVNDFTFHPENEDTVWVGTLSGPYISTDKGLHWIEKRTGMAAISAGNYSSPIQKILFVPGNPLHLLAFEGTHRNWGNANAHWGGVWESLDGGGTWNLRSSIGQPGDWPGIVAVQFAAGNDSVLFAAHQKLGVFKSTDTGKTWERTGKGTIMGDPSGIVCDPFNDSVIYVSTYCYEQDGWQPGAIFKSTDQGQSWIKKIKGLNQSSATVKGNTASFSALAVSTSDPEILYAGDLCNWPSGMYRSADGGESWVNVLEGGKYGSIVKAYVPGPKMYALAVSPTDANRMIAGNSETVYQTKDGGSTFKDITSACVATDPERFSGNGYSGLCAVDFQYNPVVPGHSMFGAMDDGFFWQSRDGYQSWKWGGNGLSHWGGSSEISVGGVAGSVIYVTLGQAGKFKSIARSTDGGDSWVELNSSNSAGLPAKNTGGKMATSIYVNPADTRLVWAVVGGDLLRSLNGAGSWSTILSGKGAQKINASRQDPLKFYISTNEGIYRTTDGETFSLMPGSPVQAVEIRVDPFNDERVYASVWRQPSADAGLYRYDGQHWKRIWDNAFVYGISVDPSDSSRIIVSTHDHPYHDYTAATGVFLSEDYGKTFFAVNDGLPVLRVQCVRFNPFNPREVVCGTGGRGYFLGNLRYPDTTFEASETIPARLCDRQTGLYFIQNDQAMGYAGDQDTLIFERVNFNKAYPVFSLTGKNSGTENINVELYMDDVQTGMVTIPAGTVASSIFTDTIPARTGLHKVTLIITGSGEQKGEISSFTFGSPETTGRIDQMPQNHHFIRLYPNPVTGQRLNIKFTGFDMNREYTVRMVSMSGDLIYQKTDIIGSSGIFTVILPAKQEITGIHMVNIFSGGRRIFSDLVVLAKS